MAETTVASPIGGAARQEIKRLGYRLLLEFSPDGFECHATYEPSGTGGTPLGAGELEGFLKQFRICEGLIPEAIAALLNSAASAAGVAGLLIAQGKAMIPGEDGKIVLTVADALAGSKGEDPADTVNLHHVQAFLNVDADEVIAVVCPPGAGSPGRSVTGREIPAQPGKPVDLVVGRNVRLNDDGATLYATETGRVYCRDGEISVEDIYEIDGDVDFHVGTIDFRGFVEVKGDVLDGFDIHATKGIKIHGIVGISTLSSQGDIFLCGLNGQGKSKVCCGGNLVANYLHDAIIECSGNVSVEVEVRNCHINCLGDIRVNKGGISGGDSVALAGVECGALGNASSLRTSVVVGSHFRDLEELNSLFNELKQLVTQFSSAPKGTVDPAEFTAKRTGITQRIHDVRERTYDHANAKVNVRKMLYDGVVITLGLQTETFREPRPGPVSVIENTIEGGFRFLGMTDLAFNAREIEKTFVQQHLMQQKNSGGTTGEGQ